MKSVLISIQSKWCEMIANGIKTIEVRKTMPKIEMPFKCYIYCTKKFYRKGDGYFQGRCCGKVIGEFICNKTQNLFSNSHFWIDENIVNKTCLNNYEIRKYANGADKIYGWHISDLKIYDTPKELSGFIPNCTGLQNGECVDFKNTSCPCQERDYNSDGTINVCKCINRMKRPPQSWCYVAEVEE